MSQSNAVITPPNIVLSPMRVTFGGVDLGGTEGGVSFGPKYKLAPIKVDQFGDTEVDAAVSGIAFDCKFILAESKNMANWKVAFPHMKLVGGNAVVYADMSIGDRISAHAQVLVLHPLANADADLTGDIKGFKVVAKSVSEIKYGPDKQTGLSVDLTFLPDTTVTPARFVLVGDPTTGIVNAAAASAVAGSNTGNGTVSAISAVNSGTKTETITLTCVGQTGGNNFSVSGSVSGPLGVFAIGSASGSTHSFTSAVINFTLNQSTVQFVEGDTFTIATTAANYA